MELFDQLEPESRERLEGVAETLHVRSGQYLIHRGDEDGAVYRLLSGRLEIVDGSSRPEFIIRVLGPGAVVGEMTFLGRSSRTADVRAGEPSVVLRWRFDSLREQLQANPHLAHDFYRAAARVLAERLEVLTRVATHGVNERADRLADGAAEGAREVADLLKDTFREADSLLRGGAGRDQVHTELSAGLEVFVERGRQVLDGLSEAETEAVSALLSQELHPYLVRSRLAEQALAPREGQVLSRAPMLAHLALGNPRGSDPLGRALDDLLLHSPTAAAIRARAVHISRLATDALPAARPGALRALVIGAGTGALVAALGRPIMEQGGELTCIDSDREALSFLESGTSVRSSRLSLRLVHTDLPAFLHGRSDVFLTPQHLVVVDELLEYLPDRVVASMARVILGLLQPGARLLLGFLSPSPDAFAFQHLLRWPMVRREASSVADMLSGVGYTDTRIDWSDEVGCVVSAARPTR